MGRIHTRTALVEILRNSPFGRIPEQLRTFRTNELVGALFSLLCHRCEVVRWRAVSAFGVVIPEIADDDVEAARVIMRRFLWMLNDESGGIGWGIPEAMAEVMHRHDRLAAEYLHMLVSYVRKDGNEPHQDGNFLELPMLQQGVLWGVCRVAERHRTRLLDLGVADDLDGYFRSEDSQVRGLVCRLAGLLRLEEHRRSIAACLPDEGRVRIYEDGRFSDYTVGMLAREAEKRFEPFCSGGAGRDLQDSRR